METVITKCAGCEDDPQTKDHIHWFTNFFGQRTKVYVIEGTVFFSLTLALRFIREELDCNMREAMIYLKALPSFYSK